MNFSCNLRASSPSAQALVAGHGSIYVMTQRMHDRNVNEAHLSLDSEHHLQPFNFQPIFFHRRLSFFLPLLTHLFPFPSTPSRLPAFGCCVKKARTGVEPVASYKDVNWERTIRGDREWVRETGWPSDRRGSGAIGYFRSISLLKVLRRRLLLARRALQKSTYDSNWVTVCN